MSDTISPNVVILTRDELRAREDAAFQRGVERGKFEASSKAQSERVARNCTNWRSADRPAYPGQGFCDACGAQWQNCEVNADFKCPHFSARRLPTSPPQTEGQQT